MIATTVIGNFTYFEMIPSNGDTLCCGLES